VYLRGKIYQKKERKKEKQEDKFIQKIYHKKKKDNITLLRPRLVCGLSSPLEKD
jgi:hypothetical protein